MTLLYAPIVVSEKRDVMGELLRDPTQPLFYRVSKPQKQAIILQGIMIRKTGKEAIINGQRVTVGDVVSGAKVIAIEEGYITILQGGVNSNVFLRPSIRG